MSLAADGEPRVRSRRDTLQSARQAASRAGVTRLGDVSGLAGFDVPVWQAVRPRSRSLSVSQGKGLTPTAAKISALLEAAELFVAEEVRASAIPQTPPSFTSDVSAIWCDRDRDPLAISLDFSLARSWLPARMLGCGTATQMPFDLVSMDFTREGFPDTVRTSAGLATGNTLDEAIAAALAELLEHDSLAQFAVFTPREKRARELDLDSIDDALLVSLIRRIRRRGVTIKVWDIGAGRGAPAFRCVILDVTDARQALPPASGTGCHVSKNVALLRAILEAVQTRITIIAGGRDDLEPADYRSAAERNMAVLFGALSFGAPPLQWENAYPHVVIAPAPAAVDMLLAECQRRTSLPVLLHVHEPLEPTLPVIRLVCPGLRNLARRRSGAMRASLPRSAIVTTTTTTTHRRPMVFVGPSLPAHEVPDEVEVRPPAYCGDLATLLDDPPPAIGLIDGVFESGPTVWHKEIIDLMARGVAVLGGASLGALRAAELENEGMVGVGKIFAAYRSGEICRDDAVMLYHAPAELAYLPVTLALVDAEYSLGHVDIDAGERRALLRIMRRMHFGERTWEACLAEYRRRMGRPSSLDRDRLAALPSLKSADARILVGMLRARCYARPSCAPPPMTRFYSTMLARQGRVAR